uniref:Neutral/alkaline non-lysosomal ceramidase N-terminal domain-containing protein n=1 Tax=Roseihalotalea indica TaxID=2867963 RepID=A0AA49JKP8_9BACT|nr:neutral/alkaline non-lysosomal ceramidase N-terminal domain-containing protein [Tunicatimonas sp. TK19036]
MIPLVLFLSTFLSTYTQAQMNESGWKAGAASVVITPTQSLWMAGYAARDHPAEGLLHDIYAKALMLEDASGNQAVLITTDLVGIPKGLSDTIRNRIEREYGLSNAQILLNSSHTHTGPVLVNALSDIYPLNEQQLAQVAQYSADLANQIVGLVGDALGKLEPASIFAQNGVARFQVNRRNNNEALLTTQTELKGPNDYAVPVIKVVNAEGTVKAIAFGYACHPTVLSFYQWSGDYPGFAQIALEEKYPEATALFFQGAGADQNPLPRRTVALAQQYGQTLAAAVERVLSEEMQELSPQLTTVYSQIDLTLNRLPDREVLTEMVEDAPDYQQRWAQRMLDSLDVGVELPDSYPYPLQIWRLGEQTIFSLGGEVVVEYAIKLKQMYGTEVFVAGYSNDVMAYIPSAKILQEGGYEGASSQIVYGHTGTWTSDIESNIIQGMVQLAEEAGVLKAQSWLLPK